MDQFFYKRPNVVSELMEYVGNMPVCNEIIFHNYFDSLCSNARFLAEVFQQIFVRTRRVLRLLFNKFLGYDFKTMNEYNRARFASIVDDLRQIARQVGEGLRRSQLERTPFPDTIVIYVLKDLYAQLEKIELINQFEQDFKLQRVILSKEDLPFYDF